MGRSEGAVKLLLFRAVHGLRRRFGEQEKDQ
jgi:DNA-directed RNA polymerase specialized sigma24 family protein